MIWEAGIAVIVIGYIFAYWREGLTHPIPLMLVYWLIMLPGKYFLFVAMGIPFTGGVQKSIIDQGSLCLFVFLFGVVLFHGFFSRIRLSFPLVEAVPRFGFAWPTLGLMAATITLAVSEGGFGILRNSLKLRAAAETGFGSYLSTFMTFSMITATVTLASRKERWPLVAFSLILTAYFMVMARTGLVVLLATTYLSYLCMVRRVVPGRTLFWGAVILAPISLAQGVLRQAGGYTTDAYLIVARRMSSDSMIHFIATSFGSRVNQLESFSIFVDYLRRGIIKSDPISPLYLFAQTVPRTVWPDKPEVFSYEMTNYVSPRSHALHVVYNFVGPAELMYAFGIVAGIVLTGAVYGYLFAVMDRYYIFCRDRPDAYLFLAITVLVYIGGASQGGLINSLAFLDLLIYVVTLAVFFRLKIHSIPGDNEGFSGAVSVQN